MKPSDAWFATRTPGAVVTIADPDPDDPARGWRRWLDERSVVDLLLMQEPVLAQPLFAAQPIRGSYPEEVESTTRWLDARIAWLDGALAATG